MQPNTITLGVDVANDETVVDYDFTDFDRFSSRSIYNGENHDMSARDFMTLYRTEPKQNGNFKGVGKTSVKFTRDIVVLGVDGLAQLTSPMIVEISFSLPVGTTSAQATEMRQRVIALLDQFGTILLVFVTK